MIRLTPDQKKALTPLAEAQGISKQEATARAIVDAASLHVQANRVAALSATERERCAALLDRLAQ